MGGLPWGTDMMVADAGPSIAHCPSHDHISKTMQDRPMATMEHY